MKLESERLILRPININDKIEIFAYRSDKETNKYQGWIPKTIEDVEAPSWRAFVTRVGIYHQMVQVYQLARVCNACRYIPPNGSDLQS